MKTQNKWYILLFAGFMLLSATSLAQRGQGMRNRPMRGNDRPMLEARCQMIPDLTGEQQTKIEKLRTEQLKRMTDYRNQIMEKRARLRTLQTKDNPDMNAVNSVIEEMGDIRTTMHKNRSEHIQEIRALLTDDQRAFFDSRMMNRRGKGMRGARMQAPRMRGW